MIDPDNRIWFTDYGAAELGKGCGDSKFDALIDIKSAQECQDAQNTLQKYEEYFKNSTYVHALGNGADLPFGCISDKVSYKHYVYWNPDGSAISNDPNIRAICKKSKGKNLSKIFSKEVNNFYTTL